MDVLEESIIYATKKHQGQIRKLAMTPYILHPLEVASIISTITDDKEIMAAGVLHDTIEDCGADPREIKALFGPKVSALVQSETEDRLSKKPAEETWMERKKDSLLALEHTKDMGVKILWLGDKLSNIRSFWREYQKIGDGIFSSLHQKDPKMQGWYYKEILRLLSDLSETAAYKEYQRLVFDIFGQDD